MRAPITFAYRNLVFAGAADEAWALYRVQLSSYAGMTDVQKRDLLGLVASWAWAIERDFQLLRVSREWSVDGYVEQARSSADPAHCHSDGWESLLAEHRDMLAPRKTVRPEVYLAVRSSDRDPGLGQRVVAAVDGWTGLAALARDLLVAPAAGLSQRRLDALVVEERRLFERTTSYLDCEPASTAEVEWLVRRAFCRALGEPMVEGAGAQALVFADEDDELRYVPLERDLLRLTDSPVVVGGRGLVAHGEAGESHQALLAVGALPEVAAFPGRQAELLFAPLEALEFPVDASLCARFVANRDAVALARRKIVDADNIYSEEAHGDHGPSSASADRPAAARELEDYLTSSGRPPLLCASISLAVAGESADELEERVERVRREYAPIALHRPLGDQLGLFEQHLPAQRSRVAAYDDYLTVEQLGAMVPTACHSIGSDAGPYVGHTLSGSEQPVRWDLREASRTSRPPSTFLVGTPGAGKTIALQCLEYVAFLSGSRIVDVDPKGSDDHRLDRLPGVEGHVERIELAAGEEFRGMLDPLRIGLPDLREDLTVSFLFDVLPQPVPPEWKRELIAAVRATLTQAEEAGRPASCGQVIDRLTRTGVGDDARAAGETLEVYADTGLARLAFGSPDSAVAEAGDRQVTMLGIRNLARPLPGTPRSEFTEEERIGRSLLRLLAALATRLLATDPTRHAVGGIDEAHDLLDDAAGRRLIQTLNRMARSLNITPLLASQTVPEDELASLVGAVFAFRMETLREAGRVVETLGHGGEDGDHAGRLTRLRPGQCMVRDYQSRVGWMQFEVPAEHLALLDTTPPQHNDGGGDGREALAA